MNIIILSGGSGRRLWPLSNEVRSKQFIKLFKTENGEYESMMQRVYRQIKEADPDAKITIATARDQIPFIRNQLGDGVGISPEPCRRDTFPAIALATAYLLDELHADPEEGLVVCPVDHFVEPDYFRAFLKLAQHAEEQKSGITLMGICPTNPDTGYGYIVPGEEADPAKVSCFKEKPDLENAVKLLEEGALWNAGVFAFLPKYLMKRAHELIDFTDYADLYAKYESLQKISFDYAVLEKESNIQVLRFHGTWQDVGTWDRLSNHLDEAVLGSGTIADNCSGVKIVNETDLPILAMGLSDVVISASAEGILVSDMESSALIKPYADKIDSKVMFGEKTWGSFKILDVEKTSTTIKVTLNPGHAMNYHSHAHRDEIWNVIAGTGRTVVDGMEQIIHAGDVITMKAGCRHMVMADTELKLIEVQLGEDISIKDKQVFDRDDA